MLLAILETQKKYFLNLSWLIRLCVMCREEISGLHQLGWGWGWEMGVGREYQSNQISSLPAISYLPECASTSTCKPFGVYSNTICLSFPTRACEYAGRCIFSIFYCICFSVCRKHVFLTCVFNRNCSGSILPLPLLRFLSFYLPFLFLTLLLSPWRQYRIENNSK